KEAWTLVAFLTAPEQLLERARLAGQYPPRPALYDSPSLRRALAVPPAQARRIIERAVPRPVTPVYAELSEALQVQLHAALTGQLDDARALAEAARDMRAVLEHAGLLPEAKPPRSGAGENRTIVLGAIGVLLGAAVAMWIWRRHRGLPAVPAPSR